MTDNRVYVVVTGIYAFIYFFLKDSKNTVLAIGV